MITVTVSHRNGQRQDVLLAGVPRVGESVRLKSTDPSEPSLIVEDVLWSERRDSNGEPGVIVFVDHQRSASSRR